MTKKTIYLLYEKLKEIKTNRKNVTVIAKTDF